MSFTPAPGLRPTTDRVRETLFNWLDPHIHGARCADLFAGSGALGLEALSRGAGAVDFCDSAGPATALIQQHLQTLQAQNRGHCHRMPANAFLENASEPFDIVFIDPPFGAGLVDSACVLLNQRKLLAPNALVYIETGNGEKLPSLPPHWAPHRDKRAGEVCYRLFVVS